MYAIRYTVHLVFFRMESSLLQIVSKYIMACILVEVAKPIRSNSSCVADFKLLTYIQQL